MEEQIDYSSHKFNCGDRLRNHFNHSGVVVGVWLKECSSGERLWFYRLDGLPFATASWWNEKLLTKED